ncbi:putative transcriptional regulatory protein pdtaR [Jannaschia seosinensis]|uniref:Putative transcriptional regulatory protein pdtaR n=1 Tax=Jannaschia seosinensis TaxID=313367 RepID=A0A0M7BE33_9RHOB|nr:response regulator [Jannaschia seosinensis]CUH39556.1 putative transcriptional regulatory protein pdtaR [Jannaschia seosinensis]
MTEGEILVLEDEMLIAMDIEATLRDAGYENLRVCSSASDARAYLDEHTPVVAVLDVNLGRGETSFDIARELHARGCPLLFMSGYTASTVQLPAELDDARRLSKPFADRDLLAALSEVVPS